MAHKVAATGEQIKTYIFTDTLPTGEYFFFIHFLVFCVVGVICDLG